MKDALYIFLSFYFRGLKRGVPGRNEKSQVVVKGSYHRAVIITGENRPAGFYTHLNHPESPRQPPPVP